MRTLLLALVAVLLVATVVLPLALLASEGGDVAALREAGPALRNTVGLGLGVAALTSVLGVPLGVALASTRSRWLLAAGTLPYALPPYVTTIAWIQLASPSHGWLRPWLPVDVYSLGGMIWVLGLHLAPCVALPVRDAWLRLDPALLEAARLAGASPARVLWSITLPLLRPAWLAGAGLALAASTASFGVPYLLSAAARSPTPVLTTRIGQALELSPETGRPVAVTLALLLLTVGLGLPALLRLAASGRTDAARPTRPPPEGGLAGRLAVIAYVGLAAVLPLAVLLLSSLMARYGTVAVDNLTLAHWTSLAADARTREALGRSAVLAVGAATVATAVGALVAHAAARTPTRGTRTLAALARLPYAVPGTVLALGLLLATSQEVRLIVADRLTFALALADTAWLLGLAYAVKLVALPVDGVGAAVRSLHPSLEEAARLSGATWTRTLRSITLPILRPALLSSWWLVALPAFCEVTLSVLLKGPRTEVVGTRLFTLQAYADPQAACALAVAIGALGVLAQATRRA